MSSYLRTLEMLEQGGRRTVSSIGLARLEGIKPVQVRRDLAYFGSFGKRGVGYDVKELKQSISRILGLDKRWNVVIIGSAQFARVLINSDTFRMKNFSVTKIFDPEFKGKAMSGIPVYDLEELEARLDPEAESLAIMTVPPRDVQSVIHRLGRTGIQGVLYFASRTVVAPDNLIVRNQDVSIELGTLTFHIANKTKHPVKVI